jgi:hypothetical protein
MEGRPEDNQLNRLPRIVVSSSSSASSSSSSSPSPPTSSSYSVVWAGEIPPHLQLTEAYCANPAI